MALAERLAATIGSVAHGLRIRDDAREVADEVLDLAADALRLYDTHPAWPSLLTDSGFPVEISVKLAAAGVALRCVTDVTDHRLPLERNWTRYVEHGSRVAGAVGADAPVWELCARHLDGVPVRFPSKLMHGLGWGPAGWHRGSLYFRIPWLDERERTSRLPEVVATLAAVAERHRSPVDGCIEVMGYDLLPDGLRAKAYTWVEAEPNDDFVARFGDHPDLAPAAGVFDAFRSNLGGGPASRFFLQTSFEGDHAGQRLFFFASDCGWTDPHELGRLFELLEGGLGLDLDPLELLADAAQAHGLEVSTALLAVGLEQGVPTATFYVWPTDVATPAAVSALASRVPQTGPTAGFPAANSGPIGAAARLETADAARTALDLLALQHDAGAWTCPPWLDPLLPTWWAIRALRRFLDLGLVDDPAERSACIAAIERAADFVASAAVEAEPAALALWLAASAATGREVPEARRARVIVALARLQHPDGTCRGGPFAAYADGLRVDPERSLTTALVRAVLSELED